MNKDILKKKNKELDYIKDGDFLIERTSQTDFQLERFFDLESGAKANYLIIVDSPVKGELLREWTLNNSSELKSHRLFLSDQNDRKWCFNHDIGEGARVDSRSLVLAIKEEKMNLESVYNFAGYYSYGRIKIDSLLAGKAELKFYSDVNVLPSAQKSDTRVDMSLRLSGEAVRSEMIPGLNIAANDVKAGHSAGTFRLKAEDLFYLRSRGLSELEIQALFIAYLSKSFVADFDDENLKAELVKLINESL